MQNSLRLIALFTNFQESIFNTLFIYTELITGSCTELLMSTQIIDALLKASQEAKLYRRSHTENFGHLKLL